MMHLCLIADQRLQEFELSAEGGTFYTFLSSWDPARAEDDALILPEGWEASRVGEPCGSVVSLKGEANYSLKKQDRQALLMVRYGGPEAVQTVDLLQTERFSVGRSRQNELCCRDGYLSSFHGVFCFDREGQLWYEDESTNGTFVNGTLLHRDRCRLQTGDQLDFPPCMRVVIHGGVLHVRCPREHTALLLQEARAAEGGSHAAMYVQPAGRLFHLEVPNSVHTLEGFLASAAAQMEENAAGYLGRSVVLRYADSRKLVADDAAFGEALRTGALVLLAT